MCKGITFFPFYVKGMNTLSGGDHFPFWAFPACAFAMAFPMRASSLRNDWGAMISYQKKSHNIHMETKFMYFCTSN